MRRAREVVTGLKALSYIIIDTETTGLEPQSNEIIEVAALKIVKGEIADSFASLININGDLPPEIVRITGITREMLDDGEDKFAVMEKLHAFAADTPLVAHNVDFDLPFLNRHLGETLGQTLPNPTICTLKLSRRLLPGLPSHKLAKVAAHFQIPTPLTHRAPGDVEITYQLWLKLIEMLEKQGISTLEALLKT
ncbi:hypothetical protein A2625_05525 [candidate division WOR-1 bacterium RIFCSPHIGHO2_01_FULL_53_15]|uniref:Exonuclease domain-containing protein n=1 Tax=candidate division WOR-1 bacterium RIFCSPHIGHO2_01_FULL_53_15 TaxID=1802564 RepID=A0A1F4Q1Z0_UNCSA|nr:MAG: hypothetical protein A2625_05525 [candidate division WOR-1 bacterium RIFCSPHIGHO2_01_FULL_53_15]OGC13136.1 MAG: hypothetical protein A3D23_00470 [candidate division WOR-1 bacterium RIFCSPHIGHO2_02_FULL_53_26]